ncbi:unnamed protein product [Plutella xylostella]|uniref:(diamondback moth) hypothetical protein n=1 Tax=Plutella xylostella TaxID=51655 RepID=A0A8S4FHP2_PLUXY|nr:unnamed protein product [Plutella xylostella]
MTMSESVSSSSSKVSQFGLYRTIDSRTEEFLKLSKKRQIRQGFTVVGCEKAFDTKNYKKKAHARIANDITSEMRSNTSLSYANAI